MRGYYSKNSKLDFGMYKGYDLGIVYIFDPSYIDWCINNIDKFYITDLDELKELEVINENLDWQYKMIGDPSLIPNIDVFDFQDLIDMNITLGDKKYKFSEETLNKNEQKSNLSTYLNSHENNYDEGYGYSSNDDYDEYSSNDEYDEYGGDDEYDEYGGDVCPACGARGEYMCCNYWIERNT
jgi:hypothetical protein